MSNIETFYRSRIWLINSLFSLILGCFFTLNLSANDAELNFSEKNKIFVFELNEGIYPSAWRLVQKAVDKAEAEEADYLIMKLNTYGGSVKSADSIRTKLLRAKPTSIVLIDNNAASAGALISIACDSIYMAESAQIGAATVVNAKGAQMPDKYQSYMRATMRSTAESQHRNPQIAEAMVDERIIVPGIVDSTQVLTFTTLEAIEHGYCDGQFNSVKEVIAHLQLDNPIVTYYEKSTVEKIASIFLNPVISSFLMMIMFAGIYFELQSPGIGFPLMAGITAAILYFMPNYLEGLAQNWEILLFIAGLLLIAVEVLVFPGFGVAGITGVTASVTGLALAMVENDYLDFSMVSTAHVGLSLMLVVGSMVGSIIIALLFGRKMIDSPLFDRMTLNKSQTTEDGYTIEDKKTASLIDMSGVAATDLRISGTVEINGERYDAITTGDFLEKGTKIIVVEYESNYLIVKQLEQ